MGHISTEYFFVLAALCAYGLAGGFAIVPFRRSLRFGIFAAPLAGLLCVSMGTAVFYAVAGLTTRNALIISWSACTLVTLVSLAVARPKLAWRDLAGLLAVLLVLAPVVTRITDVASVKAHGPALHFADATDQIGYAQAADWLAAHRVSDLPAATPEQPFHAWLTVLFQLDPRFGAHFFLASISIVRGVSGAFSFDVACAVALSAALLGVAGAFARSWASLAVVLAGLLLCHWYEHTRLGYLGKVLAYPGMLLIAGLFFQTIESLSLESILVVAMLTAATAIVHSGAATAMFLVSICATGLLARPLFAPPRARLEAARTSWNGGLILALLTGTAVMSSGLPARPALTPLPHFDLTWKYLFPRVQDLEHQGANIVNTPNDHRPPLIFGRDGKLVSGLKAKSVRRLATGSAVIWAIFLLVALVRKDAPATGLFLGPALVLLIFRAENIASEALQLVGIAYPAAVCGIARLMALPPPPPRTVASRLPLAGLVLAVVFIGMRGPRFAGSVKRYAGDARPRSQEFKLRQIEQIVQYAGNEPVELRINALPHLLLAMVELNNRGVRVQFIPSSYYSAFAYMGWPMPHYPPPKMILMIATDAPPPGWKPKLRAGPYILFAL